MAKDWSLLARRVRAFTAGLPLCQDTEQSGALIRQELVFGERKPTPPVGSNGYTDLVAQRTSHILLELELLLPVAVASCSD